MKEIKYLVEKESAGSRLDKFILKKLPEYSRAFIIKLINNEKISINGKKIKPSKILKEGDAIEICLPETKKLSLIPQPEINLDIVYEDDDLLVINKPAGISAHPSENEPNGTIANWLVARYPEIKKVGENSLRPGIIHRLDKDTSGLMVIAKTNEMFLWLKNRFQNHKIEKKYLALIYGHLKEREGKIEFKIGKLGVKQITEKTHIKKTPAKMRAATTLYKLKKRFKDYDLMEVRPLTGRMHQIRVHFASVGHPVVCDKKYASKKYECPSNLKRHFLHAYFLSFEKPNGQKLAFESELPKELDNFLNTCYSI